MAGKPKLVVLTGAGISAESGLKTFRDSGGLWEQYDVMEVASIEGWYRNPALVLEFYNARRRQLDCVEPNEGHKALVELEQWFDTVIVTQNVDDLHERAGSSHVIHLHGELRKVRSTVDENLVYDWKGDLKLGDKCEKGSQLRPHIVWFGELVPMIEVAARHFASADIIVVVGTSLQVYPAAGLLAYAPRNIEVFYVDPKPVFSHEIQAFPNLRVIPEPASSGVRKVVDALRPKKQG